MARLWLTFGLLTPLFAIFIVQQTSLAEKYWPWFLATHPDSPQASKQQPGSVGHGPSLAQELGQGDQRPLQAPKPPVMVHHASNVQGNLPEDAFVRRIVAVGDLHGDFGNARKVLEMSGVISKEGEWTGLVDFFVQTGDIIDRGDDTIKLFSYMDKLRDQALAAGGMVLSHLGNHEWMNVIGDWRYVYPSEIETFGSVEARGKMITAGRIGKSWAANYTTTSRLPLHPSLGPPNTDYDSSFSSPISHSALSFVHGGLAPTYSDLTPYPSKINEIASSLLRKLQTRKFPLVHPPNPYPGLPRSATKEENRLYGGDGPLWYRGWALDEDEGVEGGLCDRADAVMEKIGVRRLIVGHTPDFEKIVSRCGGKVIIIDTGISHAYGGVLSALSITYSLTPLLPTKDGEARWRERETVVAVYPDRQDLLADDVRVIAGDL